MTPEEKREKDMRNREAQAAYRQRKKESWDNIIKALADAEGSVEQLRVEVAQWRSLATDLRRENTTLKEALAQQPVTDSGPQSAELVQWRQYAASLRSENAALQAALCAANQPLA